MKISTWKLIGYIGLMGAFGAFLFFRDGLRGVAYALEYTAPAISSGSFGTVTVLATGSSVVPPNRLKCRYTISFSNFSSSDTVFAMLNSSASLITNGFPFAPKDKISIDLDPLGPNTTWYFQANTGSTGVDIRYMELGCPGGFQ